MFNSSNKSVKADKKKTILLPDLCSYETVVSLFFPLQVFAFILTLLQQDLIQFDWLKFFFITLFIMMVAITCSALLCYLRMPLSNLNSRTSALLIILMIMIITAIYSVLCAYFLHLMGLIGSMGYSFSLASVLNQLVTNVIISALLGWMMLRYFVIQQELQDRQTSELRSKLQSLQSKIRPHFLFNSMNIIVSLIPTDPELAEQVVEDLSSLFRLTLQEFTGLTSLQNEIDLCKRYANIEKLRLGKRLSVQWNLEEAYLDAKVPMLLLQPLIENAIYHGIQPLTDGGTICVDAFNDNGILYIRVSNPVLPLLERYNSPNSHKKGNKMALENIDNRLNVIFGSKAGINITEKEDTFIAELYLPYARFSAEDEK